MQEMPTLPPTATYWMTLRKTLLQATNGLQELSELIQLLIARAYGDDFWFCDSPLVPAVVWTILERKLNYEELAIHCNNTIVPWSSERSSVSDVDAL